MNLTLRSLRFGSPWSVVAVAAGIGATALMQFAGVAAPPDKPAAKPFGIDKRVPWTSSKVVGTPEPPAPYVTERLFPNLKFERAVDMGFAPGSDRCFVADQGGVIHTFAGPADAKAEPFLDIRGKAKTDRRELYAFTFHPKYEANGYVYVAYNEKRPRPARNRVSRYQRDPKNPLRCDPDSEHILIEWITDGHNGCCLKFGPDGMLYISTGDGSGIADEWDTGQNLTDLLCCILRIDVDRSDTAKLYGIPSDNPFTDLKGARPEIWAYGLRNPLRMSFDRKTGDLWCGDVGQDLWEMVYRIKKGGNYGWSAREGNHEFRPNRKRGGPSPFEPPVVEHPHSDFRSVTGGFVYRGARLPELTGTYVYGDYETGLIWGFRYADGKVSDLRELADSPQHIIGFGEDHAGELYVLTYEGEIHRLVPAPKAAQTGDFPRKLSQTGLFESVKDHTPAPGVIPYSVNAPLWSDGARKDRFLAVPGDAKIDYDDSDGWGFPHGSVLVKTFSMGTRAGDPASQRRLETRLLVNNHGHWRGYVYVWNDGQTDADLLTASGADKPLEIREADGAVRKQNWHFPSRAECTLCHTMPPKFVLGLNTAQMNRDHTYGDVTDNQLRTLEHIGLFAKPLPKPPAALARLAPPADAAAPLDRRARSYLQANCAHCHVRWGGGQGKFEIKHSIPLEKTGIVDVEPEHGSFGIAGRGLVAAGDPDRSLFVHRMGKLGQGRMPHVASSVVDEEGVKLIREWIKSLPAK